MLLLSLEERLDENTCYLYLMELLSDFQSINAVVGCC